MKRLSKMLLILAGVVLAISIFVPIWRIELDAPQYPEGLYLLIFSYKLGGNVDIVNGLNHYIGMKTLHANDFIEFTVLPYIIGVFSLLSILTGLINSKKFLKVVFFSFVLFGVIAMVDFWRWEYDYGHNLDPTAAIVVPGMSYQPPLIGYKQLLNFGAFSIPDIGGILFILAGLLMAFVFWKEQGFTFSKGKPKAAILVSFFIVAAGISSCSPTGPADITYHTDNCDFCKMTISDNRYACEIITKKGRCYKFDDLSCLASYFRADQQLQVSEIYINDFCNPGQLLKNSSMTYLYSDAFNSPMAGNIAAFGSKDSAVVYKQKFEANYLGWNEIIDK